MKRNYQEIFVEFLKEINAFDNYKKYVDISQVVDIEGCRYDLICHFFNWKKTDEGWQYWSDINRKWNEYLKKIDTNKD